jgi:hypothetical protein
MTVAFEEFSPAHDFSDYTPIARRPSGVIYHGDKQGNAFCLRVATIIERAFCPYGQHLREAFPFDQPPRYMLRDRDHELHPLFSASYSAVAWQSLVW